ncbi:MAG: helix-turn-helix domain-containing protein [Nitrospirales bacterium]
MKISDLSIKELAAIIGVSTDTIRRAVRKAKIPARRVRTALRFDLQEVHPVCSGTRRPGLGQTRPSRRAALPAARRPTSPRLVKRGSEKDAHSRRRFSKSKGDPKLVGERNGQGFWDRPSRGRRHGGPPHQALTTSSDFGETVSPEGLWPGRKLRKTSLSKKNAKVLLVDSSPCWLDRIRYLGGLGLLVGHF